MCSAGQMLLHSYLSLPSCVPLVSVQRFVQSGLCMFVAITTWDLVHYSCFIFLRDGILGVNYELSKGGYTGILVLCLHGIL